MDLPWPKAKPDVSDVLAKLVRLAGGNVELVNNAIREVKVDDKPADLDKIVKYIRARLAPINQDIGTHTGLRVGMDVRMETAAEAPRREEDSAAHS